MADGARTSELRLLINGFQISQAIYVAVELGVPTLLAGGPRSSDELAEDVGADPPTLYRLLRALAGAGILHEDGERRFSLTELGEPLRPDAPEPLGGWARLVGRPYHWQVWSGLLESVRTGKPAFVHVHGQEPWGWRAAHPEESVIFDEAMTDLTRRANRAILEAFDFGRFATVADVGGGQGALLAAVLARHAEVRGILFDLPHVVSGAPALLEEAHVADRCEVVAGSFFDPLPAGADAYMLKSILHDWDDPEAVGILERCREACGDDTTLLVIERILGAPNEDREAKFSDLNMLVVHGAKERTGKEWDELLGASGFRVTGTTPTASGLSVIEALPG